MALNNIIRRFSSPKVVPLALRKAGRSQRYHHHCSAVLSTAAANRGGNENIFKRALPSTLHRYSTNKSVEDESLIQIRNDKIKSFEGTEAEEIPEDFPFKIVDIKQNSIRLTREYQDESVDIEFCKADLVTKVEELEDREEEEEEDKEEEEKDIINQGTLSVFVTKKNGPNSEVTEKDEHVSEILRFDCIVSQDEIYIDDLCLLLRWTGEQYKAHSLCGDLDGNLQEGLLKYLEIRGIEPSIFNFLQEYMINNDNRKHSLMLEKVKMFLQK